MWARSLLAISALTAINTQPTSYVIEKPDHVFVRSRPTANGKSLFVTLQFRIRNAADGVIARDVTKEEIIVEEDGQRIADPEITAPDIEQLTTVL
ncbi:MAG: hypothetical protein ACRD36_07750, partial [Candidatus Acidiferrum sp.]